MNRKILKSIYVLSILFIYIIYLWLKVLYNEYLPKIRHTIDCGLKNLDKCRQIT